MSANTLQPEKCSASSIDAVIALGPLLYVTIVVLAIVGRRFCYHQQRLAQSSQGPLVQSGPSTAVPLTELPNLNSQNPHDSNQV
jgi:hypothetical protein